MWHIMVKIKYELYLLIYCIIIIIYKNILFNINILNITIIIILNYSIFIIVFMQYNNYIYFFVCQK